MEYVLYGEDILFKIYNIRFFKEDIRLSSNTLLTVYIKSGDFSGSAEFSLDIRSLGEFSVDLKDMYESLDGTAILSEAYEDSFIKIESIGKGHFVFSGFLHQTYPPHKLEFETQIDQTMLKDFSKQLYKDFCMYADL